jgi:signal transduction protein with GAF and PtsI domain
MSPANIGPVKSLVRAIDIAALRALMDERLAAGFTAEALREDLARFAADHELSF